MLSELVTNAVRASPPDDEIRVELSAGPLGWGVAVSDRGAGFVLPGHDASPSPFGVGGRGLRVVSEVAGPLSVEQDQGWTVVRTTVATGSGDRVITSAGSGRSGR